MWERLPVAWSWRRSVFSPLGLAVVLGCLGLQAAWWIGWPGWHPALRVMCTLLLMIPVVALVPASNPRPLTALCVWQGFMLLSLIAVMVREVLTQEVDLRRSAAHPAGMARGV